MPNNQYGSLFDEQHLNSQQPKQQPQPEELVADGEATNVELHGMLFEDIAVSGLTPMDISMVAKMVNDRVKELERECFEGKSRGGIDTLRLALLTSFYFASELYLLQQESGLTGKANAKRIESVIEQLQRTVGPVRE